jgi:DNA polymerase-3 subunit gamma/tau
MIIRRDELGTDFRLAYRPSTIDEFIGNDSTVKAIRAYLQNGDVPHNLFFSGPSGTGKTTMAHILSLSLCCYKSDDIPCMECAACVGIIKRSWINVVDVNCGSDSGKAAIEEILSTIGNASFVPGNRIYIFEECHLLSPAAKAVFLRNMDKLTNVFMVFCTNQPDKLKDAKGENPFISRCAHYKFKKLSVSDSISMINNVIEFEGKRYSKDVIDYICTSADGVPRDIVGITGDVISSNLDSIDDIRSLIGEGPTLDDNSEESIDFCRAVLKKDIKKALLVYSKLSTKVSPESMRMALCGYLIGCLKRSHNMNISLAIDNVVQPITCTGKAAEYMFINSLFKVVFSL